MFNPLPPIQSLFLTYVLLLYFIAYLCLHFVCTFYSSMLLHLTVCVYPVAIYITPVFQLSIPSVRRHNFMTMNYPITGNFSLYFDVLFFRLVQWLKWFCEAGGLN